MLVQLILTSDGQKKEKELTKNSLCLAQLFTRAGEPVWYPWWVTSYSQVLVLRSQALWVQQSVLSGQTEHWVSLRRTMDPVSANLYDVIT